MKWLLAIFFATAAFATSEESIMVDENHGPEEQVESKYDQEDVDAKIKQEQEEAPVNDDFDPELDGIDDDMTVDEGLNDD